MPDVGPALGRLWKSLRDPPTGHPCAVTGDMLKSRWARGAAADGCETRPLWGCLLQRQGLKTHGKLEFCFLGPGPAQTAGKEGHTPGALRTAISTASGGWSLRSRHWRGGVAPPEARLLGMQVPWAQCPRTVSLCVCLCPINGFIRTPGTLH